MSVIFNSSSNGYVQCHMAVSSSSLGSGIYGSQPCKSMYLHFKKLWIVFIYVGERYLNLWQVVVGSEDLSANHDVMQIVEVWMLSNLNFDMQCLYPFNKY